ncbi:hypothetical protein BsWGS_17627 [Bradybaena similaris]
MIQTTPVQGRRLVPYASSSHQGQDPNCPRPWSTCFRCGLETDGLPVWLTLGGSPMSVCRCRALQYCTTPRCFGKESSATVPVEIATLGLVYFAMFCSSIPISLTVQFLSCF